MKPLVSIIIPTKNSSATLEECLISAKRQNYPAIEIIVIDNYSEDDTQDIAKRHTENVFQKGSERCAQRNHGASRAQGEYLLFIDSDMKLSQDVVRQCVKRVEGNTNTKGIIIPEESYGIGFWATSKKLERACYIGCDEIEAARFFCAKTFKKSGGYDERLISGEDWELSQRATRKNERARINAMIYHNEGKLSLRGLLRKKWYYGLHLHKYLARAPKETSDRQKSILRRYTLLLSKHAVWRHDPLHAGGMFAMKTAELLVMGTAHLYASQKAKKEISKQDPGTSL